MPEYQDGKHKSYLTDRFGLKKDFEFLQMHFHAPSEHSIDGEYFDAELHFVHNRSATEFAVIGVLFDVKAGRNAKEDEWLINDLKLDDLSDYHDIEMIVERINLKKFFD